MKRSTVFVLTIIAIILMIGLYQLKDYSCYKLEYGSETNLCIVNTKTSKVWLIPIYSEFDNFGDVPTTSQLMIMQMLEKDGKWNDFKDVWLAIEYKTLTDSTKNFSE